MWYALFVMTNHEEMVMHYLRKRAQMHQVDTLYELFCPTRKLVHLVRGQKVAVKKALFPGYIFLETEKVGDFWRMLRMSSKFLTVLRSEEWALETIQQTEINAVKVLLNQFGEIEFSSGLVEENRVRIISGPLKNYCGRILKINKRECKAKIELRFKGKPFFTTVGLNALDQLWKEESVNGKDFYFAT